MNKILISHKLRSDSLIFQPSLANKKSCGLSQLIYYSVLKCDEGIRSELLSNITLSGGNTKFPGFEKRLYQELSQLFDEKTNIKVRALPNRELLGWVGAARLVIMLPLQPSSTCIVLVISTILLARYCLL